MPLAHILDLPPGIATFFVALFALAVSHALADFALQGDFLALAKNPHADSDKFFGQTGKPCCLWVQALTAHTLIHAGGVWFVTGSVFLGAVELVLHWLIDFAKNEVAGTLFRSVRRG
jgi:hypothetical protein